MPAISKAWVSIADSAVDPDSPLDASLMTGIRDDLVHLREWLGAAYTAGAVQDHDHDGVNSKAVAGEIGFVRDWPGLALPSAAWDWCDGGTLSRASYAQLFAVLMKQAVVTISIASPAVVTWANHGLRTNHPVRFFTTGALPTGISAGTNGGPGAGTEYYVKAIDANTFNISATPGGANINTSGSQSGTHTAVVAPHGNGDGSTTFHKPDYRGRTTVGRDDMGGTAANRLTAGGSGIQGNVPGRSGGAETVSLASSNIPDFGLSHNAVAGTGSILVGGGKGIGGVQNTAASISTGTAGTAHQNTQPSGIVDKIIRIL